MGRIYRGNKEDPGALKLVLDAAERCYPFVYLPFKPKLPKYKHTDDPLADMVGFFGKAKEFMDQTTPKEVSEENHPIDPPFEVVSMEYAGDHYITVGKDTDPLSVNIDAIMVEEVGDKYRYYMLLETTGFGKSVLIAENEEAEKSSGIIAEMLEKLNKHNCGTEKNTATSGVSYRPEGSKKKRYISKDIVFIVADNPTRRSKALVSRDIDWSHAFDVRGHWRYYDKSDFVGYDRKGNKNQRGRTWVSHYQKNKDKEHQKKIRVIKKDR